MLDETWLASYLDKQLRLKFSSKSSFVLCLFHKPNYIMDFLGNLFYMDTKEDEMFVKDFLTKYIFDYMKRVNITREEIKIMSEKYNLPYDPNLLQKTFTTWRLKVENLW